MASPSDVAGYATGETVDEQVAVGESVTDLLIEEGIGADGSSSESEGAETTGSEDSGDEEQEGSPKSRDGSDKEGGAGGGDGSGDGGAGSALATIPASSDQPPQEFIDEEFNRRIENAKTLDELQTLATDAKKRALFYANILHRAEAIIKGKEKVIKKAAREAKKKADKEREKIENAQKRQADITVNVRIGENIYPLTTTSETTIGSLVDAVIDLMKELGKKSSGVKPKIKKNTISLIHQTDTITDRPRRTVGGWGISDGASIVVSLGLKGGTGKKRSAGASKSTYEEKLQEIKDELMLASVRGNMNPLPHIASIIKQVDELKNQTMSNPALINQFFVNLPVEKLMKIQSQMGGTNTDLKIGNISKLSFSGFYDQILENQRQIVVCEKMMKLTTQMMVLLKYANDENPAIQWSQMSKDLLDLISAKSHHEGVQATIGQNAGSAPSKDEPKK